MIRTLLAVIVFFILSVPALAADGMKQMKSPYSVAETAQRFASAAKGKGLKIFDQVDHAQGAESAGMKLRPTVVVIFGNPKVGTPLMQCAQTVGIDLPQKALIWKDADGQVWFGYNDPVYIARRHGVADCPAVARIGKALSGLAAATVASKGS